MAFNGYNVLVNPNKRGDTMPTKNKTRETVLLGLMTALLCIMAPFSVPLPGMIPISLATLAIYCCTYLIGLRRAAVCYFVYLALGCVGLPVFSGFTGGAARLLGPTGGYFLGYFAIILCEGWALKRFHNSLFMHIAGMVSGTVICYILGTVWLCFIQQIGFAAGLAAGVLPFIVGDALKIIAVSVTAPVIRSRLEKAGLLP